MTMKIDFEDFVAVCPSAMMPDTAVFASIRPMLDSSLSFIEGIVTQKIFSSLEDVEDDIQNPEYERLCSLRRYVKAYVCASAYYSAIPQLDLVLTPTGFGVVSNQNVAPASADRVQQLRRQILIQRDLSLDNIIDLLRPIVDWKRSTHGRTFFSTLFWKGEHIRRFGIPNPTRENLTEHLAEIEAAARDMQRTFSPELYMALLKAESTASTTPMQTALITMWRAATVAWCQHDDGSRNELRQSMLLFIESNIDDFPEYRDSPTYKANHLNRYENKKEDSCFFFG